MKALRLVVEVGLFYEVAEVEMIWEVEEVVVSNEAAVEAMRSEEGSGEVEGGG